ncbi:MAG: T9SS type A sorting domain-containing protein [Bacteroidota bacterium]
MRKILPLFALLFVLGMGAQAQTYPLVTIQDIQMRTPADLAACSDSSTFNNDTVRVQGVVVTPSNISSLTNANRGQIWVRDGYGSFSGLDVIQFDDPNTNGMANLIAGDSIEMTGVVFEFADHETELIPLSGVNITILGAGAAIQPTVVNVADLNDVNQENLLPSGEQWEGSYIEVQNVTVVSVDPFAGGTRVSFVVQDGNGNKLNITDRFLAQRLPNGNPPGSFVPPNPGDTYNFIRGIIIHSPNGCTGANGRGYELAPTDANDYDLNAAAPTIVNVNRSLVTPTSAQTVSVTADISDLNGIQSAELNYAVGITNTSYTTVAMALQTGNTQSGTWSADIPAQADGAFVKYYVCATDSSSNTSCVPAVPSQSDPIFYTVRDNGTTIFDVQFVPSSFASANSGYQGLDVTVEGVVTASAEATNLGFVYIQQENELAWAGLLLTGNAALATLTVGQKVTVTGTVEENFGFTTLGSVTSVTANGTGTINPVTLDPVDFTSYSFADGEPYESMLVTLANPNANQCLTVVDQNVDAPNNFAEWRVGNDCFDPQNGCRVITGRVTNTARSSLNVSYVNDAQWATTDGTMNVAPIVVNVCDDFAGITGIMDYTFGNFKLTPRNNADFAFTGPCGLSVDAAQLGEVKAYPNPFTSSFNLEYAFEGVLEDVTATVYDVMGRDLKVISLNHTSGETTIETSDLAPGNYIVKVTAESGLIDVVKINKIW